MSKHTAQAGPLCPPELLSQPISERIDYFRSRMIAHPRLIAAIDRVLRCVRHPAAGVVLLLYGPTGAGKTTLCKSIYKTLLENNMQAMVADPGYIPAAYVEIPNPASGTYNWKDHWIEVLQSLDEPLIDQKIAHARREIRRNADGRVAIDRTVDEATLRRAVETCLRMRQVNALILDEGHHLAKVGAGAGRARNQMDTIKSVANRCSTVHVLAGTYEMLLLTDTSDQLARRAVNVHLSRYHIQDKDDRKAFGGVLATLGRHLPLHQQPDLVSRYEYMYEGCGGCVGIMKEWLDRALVELLHAGGDGLDCGPDGIWAYLDATRLTDGELIRILDTTLAGEKEVASHQNRSGELRQRLYGSPDSNQATPARQITSQTGAYLSLPATQAAKKSTHGDGKEGKSAAAARRSSSKTSKPGRRNPQRDSVPDTLSSNPVPVTSTVGSDGGA